MGTIAESSKGILAQEIPGLRKGIQTGKHIIYIWGASRRTEIEALEEHGSFGRTSESKMPNGEVTTDGGIVYNTKRKPLKSGYEKRTHMYMKKEDRARVFAWKISVICGRKCRGAYGEITWFRSIICNFIYDMEIMVMVVSRSFSKHIHLERVLYGGRPLFSGKTGY